MGWTVPPAAQPETARRCHRRPPACWRALAAPPCPGRRRSAKARRCRRSAMDSYTAQPAVHVSHWPCCAVYAARPHSPPPPSLGWALCIRSRCERVERARAGSIESDLGYPAHTLSPVESRRVCPRVQWLSSLGVRRWERTLVRTSADDSDARTGGVSSCRRSTPRWM